MTLEELKTGTSKTPRTVNAELLAKIKKKSEYTFHNVNISTTLTEDQAGVILIDASASAIDITLPSTTENIGFILKRIDNSANVVRVKTSGTDKIKYNLSINANGYSFFSLFGAGDYWQVVSDGTGNWYDIDRADKNPIGTQSFNGSTIAPIGGYLVANGTLLSRTDYPYLWDYAQKSGLLVEESAKTGYEGCFTKGDGVTTFRIPDTRAMLLRTLDNGRGIDTGRVAGSYQEDSFKAHTHSLQYAISYSNGGNVAGGNGTGGINANAVASTGGTETRPKNIAYPLYIKII